MQVVALEMGFYRGGRRCIGDVFEMDESLLKKKDGKPLLPKWVKAAPDVHQAKREAAAAIKADLDKRKAGAVAASGGKAAKDKADALAKELAG